MNRFRRAGAAAVILVLAASGCSSATSEVVLSPTPIAEPAAEAIASPTPLPAVTPTSAPAPTAVPTPVPTPTVDPLTISAESLDAATARSTLTPTPCPEAAQHANISCSIALVPARADDATDESMVEIMIAVVDNGDPLGIGPVIYLQGGPGVAVVSSASRFRGLDHDVVVFDQRGVGLSRPNLECAEVDVLWENEHTDDEAERVVEGSETLVNAYRQCRDRLVGDGVDLNAFNTEAVADDVAIMRRLLGYDTWSLWGSSYGTRVGLTIMRDHPEGLRAAVLDSVVPFEIDFFATLAEHGERAVSALDAACDIESCAERHGDFAENLATLISELDASPEVVMATRPISGSTFPFRVDGAELVNMVFTELYITSALPALPRQVARIDSGGLEELVGIYVRNQDPERSPLALGVYYSTWCREEFPFYDVDVTDRFVTGADPVGVALAESFESDGIGELCEIFDIGPAASNEDEPLSSAIPTVVFAGRFDPITPPHWSKQVADALEAATFVEMPDHGHGMSTVCPRSIRVAFLVDPLAELDLSCVDGTAGPAFE